jgi:DNA-directed RNA polymerase specialized sigma24 family protein
MKAARNDIDLCNEMFSEVALERIHRIFELYDGIRPLENYVLNSIRWYAFKYYNKRKAHQCIDEMDITFEINESHLDALDSLNDVERYLVEANVFYKMSVVDIADELNWSVSQTTRSLNHVKLNLRMMYDPWLFVKEVINVCVRYKA